jgi:hypothetical protein
VEKAEASIKDEDAIMTIAVETRQSHAEVAPLEDVIRDVPKLAPRRNQLCNPHPFGKPGVEVTSFVLRDLVPLDKVYTNEVNCEIWTARLRGVAVAFKTTPTLVRARHART